MIGSVIKDVNSTGLLNSSSDAFSSARASRSRTKRRLFLILTSLSKTTLTAVFASTTNPHRSRAIAGKRMVLRALVRDVPPSIKRWAKEDRICFSSAPNWPELISNMTLHYRDEIEGNQLLTANYIQSI